MNITYKFKDVEGGAVQVTEAHIELPLYGCWTHLIITSYSVAGGTAISFTVKPLEGIVHSKRTFDATTKDRHLRIQRGRQEIGQEITFNQISGAMLHWSELRGGEVLAGRTVAKAVLDNVQSMVETIRVGIRKQIGREVRDVILAELHRRFDTITENVVREFLKEINWQAMMRGPTVAELACDEQTMGVIIGSLPGNNAIAYHPITFDGETDVPLIAGSSVALKYSKQDIANYKATGMLRRVCGPELGDQFEKCGYITFEASGYTFKIAPGKFVDCWDPDGKKTELCIHTMGFQCNPIDEISFAYLHLNNEFLAYMKEAIAWNTQDGFEWPAGSGKGVAA